MKKILLNREGCQCFTSITRRHLKEKLTFPSTQFRGHKKEKEELWGLLKRTVTMGESNTAMVLGPSGSGKTTLINCLLHELEVLNLVSNCSVVRLSGLIHTNDNLAIQGATMQLGLANVVNNKVFGSFSDKLKFMLDSLKSGNKEESKAVIFILDNFEMFCSHKNQTLLYNLFDVSQHDQTPICVIGVTSRLDITELMEKRVKSRFSHRQIHLFAEKYDFSKRLDLFKELLTLGLSNNKDDTDRKKWNFHIEALAANQKVTSVLQNMFDVDMSENTLRSFLLLLVSKLNINHSQLTTEDVTETYSEFSFDAKTLCLMDLSVIEMCLLIAMQHHLEIHNSPFNFEIIFERYLKFLSQNTSSQTKSRENIMKAFENLHFLELIRPSGKRVGKVRMEFRFYHLLVLKVQLDEAVKGFKHLPTEVQQWAKSSLQ